MVISLKISLIKKYYAGDNKGKNEQIQKTDS